MSPSGARMRASVAKCEQAPQAAARRGMWIEVAFPPAGCASLTAIIARVGMAAVTDAFRIVGDAGVALLVAQHALALAAHTAASQLSSSAASSRRRISSRSAAASSNSSRFACSSMRLRSSSMRFGISSRRPW